MSWSAKSWADHAWLSLTEEQLPPAVPPGLPSDLLVRRPDIRSAEQSLIAAGARIDVARKAYLPRISLSGFFGFESTSLSNLFKSPQSIWAFVPEVTQPIFTGGRLKSNVRFTQAQRDLFWWTTIAQFKMPFAKSLTP